MSIQFKIKNWKLALIALIFFILFTKLGFWQLSRAREKTILLDTFHTRMIHPPLSAKEMNITSDLRFYRATLSGTFDNQQILLLDNKTFRGQVGYEVYTPFKAMGLKSAILVDRGFIPLPNMRRDILPAILPMTGKIQISGLLNIPPNYVAYGKMNERSDKNLKRIEFIDLSLLAKQFGYPLYPYILTLDPKNPAAYAIEWQIITMGPERHIGYAIQWFAFALILLILFVALNCRKTSEDFRS
ncbi:MAG: hypothetical protein A3F12_05370 [Gammaproteobacteria bacterium RIFCSPHIGHO2_12_FULL_38_14]|nr:MAG: hypothetical protein A3F12_05370 [Gammaproteobacteria bacterium RIFCSPHIGHO2_12_FULL_38_14]